MNTANLNEKLFAANGRYIRFRGIVYRIIACKFNSRVLAEAEPRSPDRGKFGRLDRINLVTTRSEVGMNLRNLIALNLFV